MANKPLKTIKFPGLTDTYTVPPVDNAMSDSSTNPVQNKVIKEYVDNATPELSGDAPELFTQNLITDLHTSNNTPYLYRPTPADSDRERVKRIEGMSVGWNQLCNGSSVTVTSGHKYYMKKASVESIGASDGTALTGLTSGTDMVIDLTILFGSATIADHIYSLEQATAGSGVAWVKQYIDLDSYHPYSAPTIKSVEGLTSHDMVGFNQWDEEWLNGYYILETGVFTSNNKRVCSKNLIKVIPNTVYMATVPYSTDNVFDVIYYDADGNYLGYKTSRNSKSFTTPSGCQYIHFSCWGTYGATYNHDICINLSDPSRNGTYEPYEKHSYPLDSTITLRGIPKLVDGKLVADGDWYEPDGKQTVRYGIVDLGDLNWTYQTDNARFYTPDLASTVVKPASSVVANAICDKYPVVSWDGRSGLDKIMSVASSGNLFVFDSAYTDATAFKTAMSGIMLVYEKATPTTSTALPYTEVEICENGGTEEFVSTGLVPVGHLTEYPVNIKKQVENLYGIPKPSTGTNGTFVLKATVSNGTLTYSWVSAT